MVGRGGGWQFQTAALGGVEVTKSALCVTCVGFVIVSSLVVMFK